MGTKKDDGKGSEVRTVFTKKQPGGGHQVQEEELLIQLDAAWGQYKATESKYRASRLELGRILSELQALLARTGRNGRFAKYLREKGISKSTAYDLLEDFERLHDLDLPEVVAEVAGEENIDLSAKRLKPVITSVLPKLKAAENREQAQAVLEEVRTAGKRKSGKVDNDPNTADNNLSKGERWVWGVRLAVRKALGNVPNPRKLAVLKEALDQETDNLGIKGFTVTPKAGDLTVDGRKRKPSSTTTTKEKEEVA